MSIFETFVSVVFGCIPVILWAYIFSYFDGVQFRIHRFVYGAIAGAISVLPIAYSREIYDAV